jgi:hypothetical protein
MPLHFTPLTDPQVHDELDGRLGIVAGLEHWGLVLWEGWSPLLG